MLGNRLLDGQERRRWDYNRCYIEMPQAVVNEAFFVDNIKCCITTSMEIYLI
jgi:hypothetical protein